MNEYMQIVRTVHMHTYACTYTQMHANPNKHY